MSRTTATRYLKQLPNSWLFGVFWFAAMATMAVGAVRAALAT